jgi:hypothetical protein
LGACSGEKLLHDNTGSYLSYLIQLPVYHMFSTLADFMEDAWTIQKSIVCKLQDAVCLNVPVLAISS